MDERRLNKLINYYVEIEDLNRQLEILNDKIAVEESYVLENMQRSGSQSLTRRGYTLYIRRNLYAGLVNHDDAGKAPGMEALKKIGLGHFVKPTVNASRLSAWVREFDPEKKLSPDEILECIPAEVRNEITIAEVFKLGRRKAKMRKTS